MEYDFKEVCLFISYNPGLFEIMIANKEHEGYKFLKMEEKELPGRIGYEIVFYYKKNKED